jgi:hypothetical protein
MSGWNRRGDRFLLGAYQAYAHQFDEALVDNDILSLTSAVSLKTPAPDTDRIAPEFSCVRYQRDGDLALDAFVPTLAAHYTPTHDLTFSARYFFEARRIDVPGVDEFEAHSIKLSAEYEPGEEDEFEIGFSRRMEDLNPELTERTSQRLVVEYERELPEGFFFNVEAGSAG